MKRFAMLVEDAEIGQVCVMQQRGDDGPEIAVYFNPEVDGLGICRTAIGFSDDEAGEQKAALAFEKFDDEAAVSIARRAIASIKDMFAEDAI